MIESETVPTASNSDDEAIQCTKCDFSTVDEAELLAHTLAPHVKQEVKEKATLKPAESGESGGIIKCKYCDFTTHNRTYLPTHMAAKHTGGREFKCAKCGFSSPYKSSVYKHVRTVHPGENVAIDKVVRKAKSPPAKNVAQAADVLKPNKKAVGGGVRLNCELCSYSTYLEDSMRNHVKSDHASTPVYPCPAPSCEGVFARAPEKIAEHIMMRHISCVDARKTY